MSRELTKMNLIAIVQQLPEDDIEVIQTYIGMIEDENKRLLEYEEYYKDLCDKFLVSYSKLKKEKDTSKQELINWLESKNNITLTQHKTIEPVIKVQEVIDKIKEGE